MQCDPTKICVRWKSAEPSIAVTPARVTLLVPVNLVVAANGSNANAHSSVLSLTFKAVTSKAFWQAVQAVALLTASCV
jgi:hypothetical protein